MHWLGARTAPLLAGMVIAVVLASAAPAGAVTTSEVVRGSEHRWVQDLGEHAGALTFRIVTPDPQGNGSGTVEGYWQTDGTAAGTRVYTGDRLLGQTADYRPVWGARDDQVSTVVPAWKALGVGPGATAWFARGADDELWKTDGTAPGTVLVRKMPPPDFGSVQSIGGFFGMGDRTYFVRGIAASHELQLWRTDGTADGTVRVATMGGGYYHQPGPLAVYHDAIWWTQDGTLWRTDGTSAPTAVTSAGTWYPMVTFQDRLTMSTGGGLWSTDGTDAGSGPIAGMPALSEVKDLTVLGSWLFFTAKTDTGGTELYVSDGTGAGTHQVIDLAPGAASSSPDQLVRLGDRLYFSADDGVHGSALWRTDGTPDGTELVAVAAGAPVAAGDAVYFGKDWSIWRMPSASPTDGLPLDADALVASLHPPTPGPGTTGPGSTGSGAGSTPSPIGNHSSPSPSAAQLKALVARRLTAHGSSVLLGTVTCPPLCARVTAQAYTGRARLAYGEAHARAGHPARLRLRLTPTGRRLLTRRHRLGLRLTLKAVGADGRSVTAHVTRTCAAAARHGASVDLPR
jgi:ELWxxDGT repeat protein